MESLFTDEELTSTKQVSLAEAASILKVSTATVKNWVRQRHLVSSSSGRKLTFDVGQVENLKNQVTTGQMDRLNSRANKTVSTIKFIPAEYAEKSDTYSAIQSIVETYSQERLDLVTCLLAIILNLLEKQGLVVEGATKRRSSIQCLHKTLKKELEWWFERATGIDLPVYGGAMLRDLPVTDDLLGTVYQSLITEGVKSCNGSYFTPRTIVKSIVEDHLNEHSIVLDPCCGTGQFLLAAANRIADPTNIWGFDIDETATRIARINMILRFPETEFCPHIYCMNALLETSSIAQKESMNLPQFDAVITNPPWGSYLTDQELSKIKFVFPTIKSNEVFSMFILKGLHHLKPGGVLSYILPEAFLNIKVHADIREALLRSAKIESVDLLGRIFQGVFTPVLRIDAYKEQATLDSKFVVTSGKTSKMVEQSRLLNNPDYIFDLVANVEDFAIFEKVYSHPHLTLCGNADWALGIVTGDNAKYLSEVTGAEAEPILTGKELRRFIANPAKNFVRFIPERFQQVAPVHKYRAPEKLIYKFISTELVFAYDDQQILSLNSANIMIPFLPGYEMKTVLAFLNSSLFQMLFQRKFNAFKILKGDIEKLPFPMLTLNQNSKIVDAVNVILNPVSSNETKKEVFTQIDNYIMDIFGLSQEERLYIRSTAKMSTKLLPFT